MTSRMLVQLSEDDVRELLRSELRAALAERETPPALLDQAALARALGVSTRTVYELRRRGLPVVMVCDSPRFALGECLEWLRSPPANGSSKARAA